MQFLNRSVLPDLTQSKDSEHNAKPRFSQFPLVNQDHLWEKVEIFDAGDDYQGSLVEIVSVR